MSVDKERPRRARAQRGQGRVSRLSALHARWRGFNTIYCQAGLPRSIWLGLVNAPVPAPTAPPINAPVPGEPASAPPTAPAPAPIAPPLSARSPVVWPHAAKASKPTIIEVFKQMGFMVASIQIYLRNRQGLTAVCSFD